jgi:Flp pilus assembly protein TadG
MFNDERGSVTAEFAVTLPSLILLFFFGLQILGAVTAQQRGEAVAQVIARAITRGESQLKIDQIMQSNFPQGKLSISEYDGVVTVEIDENQIKARANGYRPQ